MKGVPGKVELYDVRGIRGDYEAHLERTDESLIRLTSGIPVRFFGMDQKILESTGRPAMISDASLKSARLACQDEITQWDDLRVVIAGTDAGAKDAEIYGKVISTSRSDVGMEALVRFTSVSPEAYKLIRRLLASPAKPK